jgi:hypothetical protein
MLERIAGTGDLPQMIATLASYDRIFGPISMQTLSVAALVGQTLAQSGENEIARRLLERVARDVIRAGVPAHPVRLTALASLRDLHLESGDLESAIAVQTELAGGWLAAAGSEAPQTVDAKARLASLLMSSASAPEA